jgi:hypothetical protein
MAWYLAGAAAGGLINNALDMNSRRQAQKAAMSKAGAWQPPALLNVERAVSDGRFFQFWVPWGWRDMRQDEVARLMGQIGIPVVAGLVAERTDGDAAEVTVRPFSAVSLPDLMMNADEFHRARFMARPNGHPLGTWRKILVGGEVGLLIHYINEVPGVLRGQPDLPVVQLSQTECLFSRLGQVFHVVFSAGSTDHDSYLPCLWTMLGTWYWLR